MKKIIYLCIAFLIIFASASSLFSAEKAITIRTAGMVNPDHNWTKSQYLFKKYLEEQSKGKIKVQVYHSGQLGGVIEVLEGVKAGTITMGFGSAGFMMRFVPSMGVYNLPYVWNKDMKRCWKILDGPYGKARAKEAEKAGLKVLGYLENGFRNITNNKRPIYSPDDLKGLKIRVISSPVYLESFKAFGASPVPMDWTEVFSALQQGVIDGQENPIPVIYTQKVYEVQKYLSLTGHANDIMVMYMNKKFYEDLPGDLKKIVSEGAHKASLWQRKENSRDNERMLALLKQKGMKVNKLTDKQISVFQERCKPVYDMFSKDLGVELVSQLIRLNQ